MARTSVLLVRCFVLIQRIGIGNFPQMIFTIWNVIRGFTFEMQKRCLSKLIPSNCEGGREGQRGRESAGIEYNRKQRAAAENIMQLITLWRLRGKLELIPVMNQDLEIDLINI